MIVAAGGNGASFRSLARSARTNLRLLRRLRRVEQRQTPFRDARPALWLKGFYSYTGELYPGVGRRPHDYISDWNYEKRLGNINPPKVLDLLRDKLAFEEYLRRRAGVVARPQHFGEILGGQLRLNVNPEVFDAGAIAKPRWGKLGRGVTLIHTIEELQSLADEGGDWVIQEVVEPHEYSSAIFPGSLNTVRIHAIRAAEDRRTILIGAAHRFGSRTTGIVDNVSAGGYVASLDMASGALGDLISYSRATGRLVSSRHPDTGVTVKGVVVPGWGAAKSLINILMAALPDALSVGFDVALTEDGPVLIEANGNPSPRLLQYHGPFLDRDPAIRSFYASYGAALPFVRLPG